MEEDKRDTPDCSHPCLVATQNYLVFPLTEYSVFHPPPPPTVQKNITAENKDSLLAATKGVGCSDSSVDPLEGAASYSWVLTDDEETATVIRAEPNKISLDDMRSFRNELTRVHSMVNCTVKNWERGADEKINVNLKLWRDNESVLKAINLKVPQPLLPCSNLRGPLSTKPGRSFSNSGKCPSTT